MGKEKYLLQLNTSDKRYSGMKKCVRKFLQQSNDEDFSTANRFFVNRKFIRTNF